MHRLEIRPRISQHETAIGAEASGYQMQQRPASTQVLHILVNYMNCSAGDNPVRKSTDGEDFRLRQFQRTEREFQRRELIRYKPSGVWRRTVRRGTLVTEPLYILLHLLLAWR